MKTALRRFNSSQFPQSSVICDNLKCSKRGFPMRSTLDSIIKGRYIKLIWEVCELILWMSLDALLFYKYISLQCVGIHLITRRTRFILERLSPWNIFHQSKIISAKLTGTRKHVINNWVLINTYTVLIGNYWTRLKGKTKPTEIWK